MEFNFKYEVGQKVVVSKNIGYDTDGNFIGKITNRSTYDSMYSVLVFTGDGRKTEIIYADEEDLLPIDKNLDRGSGFIGFSSMLYSVLIGMGAKEKEHNVFTEWVKYTEGNRWKISTSFEKPVIFCRDANKKFWVELESPIQDEDSDEINTILKYSNRQLEFIQKRMFVFDLE